MYISTINMYRYIKIRHDIIKQCHGNYKEMRKFNYKLEIEIFRNSTLKDLGVRPEGFFLRVWVSKKAPRRPAGYDHGLYPVHTVYIEYRIGFGSAHLV